MKNKKGALTQLIIFIAVLFAIVITIMLAKVIFTGIATASGGMFDDGVAPEIIDGFQDNVYPAFNNMYLIIFIGVLVVLSVTAFAARTHPAFFPVSAFVVMPILILIAAVFSNIYEAFVNANTLVGAANDSIIISNLMTNFPLYMFGYGVLILILTFGVNKSEGL
jgi:hypothetical protein